MPRMSQQRYLMLKTLSPKNYFFAGRMGRLRILGRSMPKLDA